MEVLLGLSKKTILPTEGMRLLKQAIESREEIHKEYQVQIQEEEKLISTMQDENTRLVAKITHLTNLAETDNLDKEPQ